MNKAESALKGVTDYDKAIYACLDGDGFKKESNCSAFRAMTFDDGSVVLFDRDAKDFRVGSRESDK